MSDRLQVAIIGLGFIGASAGLALRRLPDRVAVIGHDREPEAAARAARRGAVDRTDWNLVNAVSSADRVLLALPVGEIRDALAAMAGDLKPGCVVMDMADVKGPVVGWAAELVPAHAHFVGGHPVVLGGDADAEGARADLFDGASFCLTPDAQTPADAVRLAADVAGAMGACPFFMDAAEHDALVAAVEHLPAIVAGALLALASESPSWRDMRRLAGDQFFAGTLLASGAARAGVAAAVANREHAAAWVDALIEELALWRDRLLAQDEAALVEALARGSSARESWIAVQSSGRWDGTAHEGLPTAGDTLRGMLFGRPRLPGDRPQRK